jgi:pimeloyl-ACP methyl ester carboxylesterase
MPAVLYLHGFASGPQSTKGIFFRDRFAAAGIHLDLPDLSGGDFEHLTITSQLAIIDQCAAALSPRVVIGSSLGAYLAALYAARHPGVFRALVLLAPAFGFPRRYPQSLGEDQLRLWRDRGWMEVYHYGCKRPCRLSYRLVQDGEQYEEEPDVRDPTLIIHGTRDEVVSPRDSGRFASGRANVELRLVDSDHQLLDALEEIWGAVHSFVSGVLR